MKVKFGWEWKANSLPQFRNIMECAHSSEKFWSARGRHEREFEFDYLFCCFFDTNYKAFPNDDNCMLSVMCGLAALHEVVVLGRHKVQLSDRSNMEYMFCPHCGYFTNNVLAMNMLVGKHYKAGLFCGGPECSFIMNKTEAMLQMAVCSITSGVSGLNYIDSFDVSKSRCGCPAQTKFHIFAG